MVKGEMFSNCFLIPKQFFPSCDSNQMYVARKFEFTSEAVVYRYRIVVCNSRDCAKKVV